MQHSILRGFAGVVALALFAPAGAKELPSAAPQAVGMSAERLARVDTLMQRYIAAGTIANAVTLVARHGKVVHYAAHGEFNTTAHTPMRRDALFRMASSSKPVIAVAVLTLVEEGLLHLNDPVSRFIPEFRGQKVAVPRGGAAEPPPLPPGAGAAGPRPEVDLVAASRDVTIRDLLTHTSGLMSGGLGQRVSTDIQRQPADTLASFIPRLGKAALDFQPGSRWSYSSGAGFDTLGRIIEIVSGKPLDVFLRERIFVPLDLRDITFVVPADQQARLVPMWRRSAGGQWEMNLAPPAFGSDVYFSGAGGLVASARDYARFEQMLLNGGQLDGQRVLAPRSVELMRRNHTGTLYRGFRGDDEGMGFGLGVEVTLDEARAPMRRSEGTANWFGAYGTISWNDPREGIVAVLMVQQSSQPLRADFANAVMQAITESAPPR